MLHKGQSVGQCVQQGFQYICSRPCPEGLRIQENRPMGQFMSSNQRRRCSMFWQLLSMCIPVAVPQPVISSQKSNPEFPRLTHYAFSDTFMQKV